MKKSILPFVNFLMWVAVYTITVYKLVEDRTDHRVRSEITSPVVVEVMPCATTTSNIIYFGPATKH